MGEEVFYTVKELQAIYKVTRQTIYDWRKRGMPYHQVLGLVRFKMSEVEAWIEEQNKENER